MSPKAHPLERIHRKVARALSEGAERTSFNTVEWVFPNRCERPVYRELVGRPNDRLRDPDRVSEASHRFNLEMWVRCRSCGPCLRSRAAQWRLKAQVEIARASRTWFGTLTLRPEEQFLAMSRARANCARKCVRFEELTDRQRFGAIVGAIAPDITKWLKRVRAESGGPLRYCLVAEAHKSGHPHFHVLVHERSRDFPVRHATLKKQWLFGFSDFKLVADDSSGKAAAYVAKYLAKSSAARVRASLRYGQG